MSGLMERPSPKNKQKSDPIPENDTTLKVKKSEHKKQNKNYDKISSQDSSAKSSRKQKVCESDGELSEKQKKKLEKKENKATRKESKIKRNGSSNSLSAISTDDQSIPENMSVHDSDNEDIIVKKDKKEKHGTKSDSESSMNKTEDKDDVDKHMTNALVNNDDFIQFDFSDEESDEDTDEEDQDNSDETGHDSSYVPRVDDSIESGQDDDYAEPGLDGKRKAIDNKGPPQKKRDYSYEYPWMNNGYDYSSYKEISDCLTQEIKDLVSYLSPSEAEIRARNEIVQQMQKLVHSMWSDASVGVFGSYATDLYLPGSDIDMVITSPTGRLASKTFLYQLYTKLKNTPGFAKDVTAIGKARVPILKLTDRKSKIHIDISFERRNGLAAVEHIRKWAKEFPCLRYLVMIIKQFLAFRKLNDVSVGGIGGYSIICTVVSFLSLHPRVASGMIDPMKNLGPLLIEYFELYGQKFNYYWVALRMDPDKLGYVSKSEIPDLCNSGPRPVPYSLVIEDPDDPSNNISRSTYNILKVRAAFFGAYEFITTKCYELDKISKSARRNKSIIGSILNIRGPQRDFLDKRGSVENISWSKQDENQAGNDDKTETKL